MRLLFLIASFLYTGTELVLSFPSKSLVVTEKQTSIHGKVISCESASSSAEIFWADPDGKRIEYLPGESIFCVNQENKSSLIVHNISKVQEGRYTCHKYDVNGEHYQEFYQLGITAAGPPEFEKQFEDYSVSEGSDIYISCKAKGDPKPTYTWYSHVGAKVAEKKGRMYVKNKDDGLQLIITNATFDLKGMYACNAENTHGLVTKLHRLNVVDNTNDDDDTYVENATAIEVTENSVRFSLTVMNIMSADDIQIFVEYKNSSSETHDTWTFGDKHEARNLEPGGKYEFRFRVVNFRKWSDVYEVVLLPAIPDVIVESFSGGNLALSFYRKISDILTKTIDKHRVTYTSLQIEAGERFVPSTCNMSVEIPECMGSKYLISGLSNKAYYEIQVEAHTSSGYGKPFTQKIYVSY